MVYMSGCKASRNQSSLINRPTCGGPKKGGLSAGISTFISSNPNLIGGTNTQFGLVCRPNYVIQTQKYGYHAVHGGNMG